jgi:hypothetical protein
MTTTRMPGFSAESSLYGISAYAQIGGTLAGVSQRGEVVPSLIHSHCSRSGSLVACATCVDELGACYVCSSGSLGCFWVR